MKRFFSTIALLSGVVLVSAQGASRAIRNFYETEIAPLWPLILGLVFIISFLMNSGYFFGDNRDIKTGMVKMFTYVLGAVIAGYIGSLLFTFKAPH